MKRLFAILVACVFGLGIAIAQDAATGAKDLGKDVGKGAKA